MRQITGAPAVQRPGAAMQAKAATTTGPRNVPAAGTSAPGGGAQTPDFSRFQTGMTGAPGVQRPTASTLG